MYKTTISYNILMASRLEPKKHLIMFTLININGHFRLV